MGYPAFNDPFNQAAESTQRQYTSAFALGQARDEAARTNQTRQAAQDAYATGGWSGAANAFATKGDFANAQLAEQEAARRQTAQRTQQLEDAKRLAGVTQDGLRALQGIRGATPEETAQRRAQAYTANIAPILKRNGLPDEAISHMGQIAGDDTAIDAEMTALGDALDKLEIVKGSDGSYVAVDPRGSIVNGYRAPSRGSFQGLPNGGYVEEPGTPGGMLGPDGQLRGAPPVAAPAAASPTAPQGTGPSSRASVGRLDPGAFFAEFVKPHEGGLNPRDANGSPTYAGINQAANPGVDVRHMTDAQAAGIFTNKYFQQSGAANLPADLAAVHADTYFINPRQAQRMLQQSGGDPGRYMDMRDAWMQSLVRSDPGRYGKYERAWSNRNRDLRAYASRVASEGTAAAPPAPPNASARGGTATGDGSFTTPGGRVVHPGAKPTGHMATPAEKAAMGLGDSPVWINADGEPQNKADMAGGGSDNGLTGREFLKTLTPARARLVQAIADGRAAPQAVTSLRGGERQRLMEDVAQFDPNFDLSRVGARAATRKDFAAGKAAQNVTAINTAIGHLNALDRAASQLNNIDWHSGQKFINILKRESGRPEITQFEATKEALASELTRVFTGAGGSVFDREGWQDKIDAANSPRQLQGVVRSIVDLLGSRIEALGQQYEAGMGRQADPLVLLKPQAAYAYARLSGGGEAAAKEAAAKAGFYKRWDERGKPLDQVDAAWEDYRATKFGQAAPVAQGDGWKVIKVH